MSKKESKAGENSQNTAPGSVAPEALGGQPQSGAAGASGGAAAGVGSVGVGLASAAAGAVPQPDAKKQAVGIRQIKMTISKIEPLAALKLGFLISVVIGFMIIIAMAIIWFVLDGIHVFGQMEGLLQTLNSAQLLEMMQYLEFGRWMSFAVIIAILDIVLMTALSAVAALVYNIISALVGGLVDYGDRRVVRYGLRFGLWVRAGVPPDLWRWAAASRGPRGVDVGLRGGINVIPVAFGHSVWTMVQRLL